MISLYSLARIPDASNQILFSVTQPGNSSTVLGVNTGEPSSSELVPFLISSLSLPPVSTVLRTVADCSINEVLVSVLPQTEDNGELWG